MDSNHVKAIRILQQNWGSSSSPLMTFLSEIGGSPTTPTTSLLLKRLHLPRDVVMGNLSSHKKKLPLTYTTEIQFDSDAWGVLVSNISHELDSVVKWSKKINLERNKNRCS